MKRITSPNRALGLFGVGKDGFKAAVPGVSTATELTPVWFNGVQEAVVRTIEAAGLVPSEADYDQFTAALQALMALQVAALVNSSPVALNTLKELADAIGDDQNFATTMTTALAGKERKFDTGTRTVWQQTTAPVGWTKVTTHDNKALRIVSGAVGSGGTVDFTTAFVNGNTGSHVLTIAEIPAHGGHIGSLGTGGAVEDPQSNPNISSDSLGGGLGHSHTLNLDVKYVDIIIASKD